MAQQAVQKNTLYVGGLAEEVNESILHAAFIPFGDIKDVKTPLDQATQKHRSFGFVTFLEREDAAAAMDNMDGAELYGRVLTVNYALPEKIKGGEQGWAAQPRFLVKNLENMAEVVLHIYDVTNSGSDKTNSTILQINKIFKDGIGLGGIFHSAVQVYGEDEWSFGFCEQGSGVFSCPSGKNPMYTYHESIVLGTTDCSIFKVNQILRELSREWPGYSYDLLSKNCNHFCDELCERLGVPKLPGWVNRFAHAGDAAMEVAGNTAVRFRQAKTEIVTASKVAYRFLVGVTNNATASPESAGNSNRGAPRFQAAWFKNLITTGAKPSSSSDLETKEEDALRQHQQPDAEPQLQQNSRTWQSM